MLKYLTSVVLFFLLSCPETVKVKHEPAYKFFVAGHVYGYPGESEANIGVHPPFKQKLGMLREDKNILFGILTGDIVYNGALEKEWDELDADMATTDKKVYFAPGNHDIANSKKRAVFTKRYGSSYQSFVQGKDLFVVLDPNLAKWNISGKQLDWLKQELATKGPKAQNIFVFFHQLLWWAKDNHLKDYPPNSPSGRAEEINFFKEVYPLFKDLKKPVYMFAGDTGVYEKGVMYHKDNDISFIASGMGGRKEDNFIIATVHKDSTVSFELIALNGEDKDALGKLEDHTLPLKN